MKGICKFTAHDQSQSRQSQQPISFRSRLIYGLLILNATNNTTQRLATAKPYLQQPQKSKQSKFLAVFVHAFQTTDDRTATLRTCNTTTKTSPGCGGTWGPSAKSPARRHHHNHQVSVMFRVRSTSSQRRAAHSIVGSTRRDA